MHNHTDIVWRGSFLINSAYFGVRLSQNQIVNKAELHLMTIKTGHTISFTTASNCAVRRFGTNQTRIINRSSIQGAAMQSTEKLVNNGLFPDRDRLVIMSSLIYGSDVKMGQDTRIFICIKFDCFKSHIYTIRKPF